MISLAIGGLFIVVIPIQIPQSGAQYEVETVATGEKNPASKGSEVWVLGIRRADGAHVPLGDLQTPPHWELRDGALVSHQQQPARLTWQAGGDRDLTLVLLAHPWSGIMLVRWNKMNQQVDLYADPPTQKVVTLSAAPSGSAMIWRRLHDGVWYLADVLSLAILIFVVSIWLATRPLRMIPELSAPSPQSDRWSWLLYMVPCALVWSVYLLAFFPGLMSVDSISQWGQITRGRINDAHPAFHTLTNWLITRMWFSPAAVASAQILGLAVVFGLAMRELKRWGVAAWIRILITLLFSLLPLNAVTAITLWKDVPYTIAMLGLWVIILQLMRTHGHSLSSWYTAVALWLALVCIALYRHNGLPVAALMLVALYLLGAMEWPGYRSRLLLIGISWIITLGLIKGPVQKKLEIDPMPLWFALQVPIHQVAAILHAHADLTPHERKFLESIQPLALWRSNYNCYSLNSTLDTDHINKGVIQSHADLFVKTWKNLVIENPYVILRHYICMTTMLWMITQPRDGYLYVFHTGIDDNEFGLKLQPLIPKANNYLKHLLAWTVYTERTARIWESTCRWIWRPAFYLYLTVFCTIILGIRLRNYRMIGLALPSIFNSLVWAVLLTTQDFRLQYPIYIIGLLSPALLFAGRFTQERKREQPKPT